MCGRLFSILEVHNLCRDGRIVNRAVERTRRFTRSRPTLNHLMGRGALAGVYSLAGASIWENPP